jgi:hypothetical protein
VEPGGQDGKGAVHVGLGGVVFIMTKLAIF